MATSSPPATTRPRATPELETKILEFLALDQRVAALEELLGNVKALRKYVGEHELVELTTPEDRARGVTLTDGSEWTLEQVYHCGIKEPDKAVAYTYLRDVGADAMLRRVFRVSFGKDSKAHALQFKQLLAAMLPEYELTLKLGKAPTELPDAITTLLERLGLSPMVTLEEDLELPGATLRAWVIKQLKLGKTLPNEFGVYAPLRPKQMLRTGAQLSDQNEDGV